MTLQVSWAATLSSQLGRSKDAVDLYERINPSSRVYKRETHIGYLNQVASILQTDQESLSRSDYYHRIDDLYKQDDQPELAEEYYKRAILSKEKWLKYKTDLLRQVLLEPHEYRSGYQQVQKWIQEMQSAGMVDEGLEFLKASSFEPMTEPQLRHLKSNCNPERSKRWSKNQSYQAIIETIFETVMEKTKKMHFESVQELEKSEENSRGQGDYEREPLEALASALDID